MCHPLVLFILSLVIALHQPRALAAVVDHYDETYLQSGSPESSRALSEVRKRHDISLKRTKRQLVGVHLPEPQDGDQEYLDGFHQFNRFLAEQGFHGFAHSGSGHKFTPKLHELSHSAKEELGQVGEASGYDHHHDQGGYKEPPKKIKSAPYKGPRYSPYDLIAPSKSKTGKKTKYGDDPVNESKKGLYHIDKQDLPIKHFGGFGGGGSIGYNSGSLKKGQHGGGGYKGHQAVHNGHQGGFKGPNIGGFKGPGKGGFKGHDIGGIIGHGISGFKGNGNGGFKGHGKGGFKGHGKGGFKGHGNGGFKGHGNGGFKGHGNSGFKGHGKGGFKGHGNGGFKGHGNSGFKGHGKGGFKGHGKGGFNGHGISGLKGHDTGGFKGHGISGNEGHNIGGFKGHDIFALKGHEIEVFQGHDIGGLKGHHIGGHGLFEQKPQNLPHGFESHYDPNPVVQHIEQPFNTYDVHADVKANPDLAGPADVTLMLLSDPYNPSHSGKALSGYLL